MLTSDSEATAVVSGTISGEVSVATLSSWGERRNQLILTLMDPGGVARLPNTLVMWVGEPDQLITRSHASTGPCIKWDPGEKGEYCENNDPVKAFLNYQA